MSRRFFAATRSGWIASATCTADALRAGGEADTLAAMTRRLSTLLALPMFALALLAAPALAEAPKKPAGPPSIDLSPVGLPIVWDGKLINYVFVTLHLVVSPRTDAVKLREKEPYFRDALVRTAHRTPFVRPWDFTHVDRGALTTAMLRESARIAGPGAIASVQILDETPQRTSGLPQRPKP